MGLPQKWNNKVLKTGKCKSQRASSRQQVYELQPQPDSYHQPTKSSWTGTQLTDRHRGEPLTFTYQVRGHVRRSKCKFLTRPHFICSTGLSLDSKRPIKYEAVDFTSTLSTSRLLENFVDLRSGKLRKHRRRTHKINQNNHMAFFSFIFNPRVHKQEERVNDVCDE